jgi:hypothetical protein
LTDDQRALIVLKYSIYQQFPLPTDICPLFALNEFLSRNFGELIQLSQKNNPGSRDIPLKYSGFIGKNISAWIILER